MSRRLSFVALLLLLAARAAVGHPLAPSLLEVDERAGGGLEVLWKTPLLQAPGSDVRPVLPSRCRATSRRRAWEEQGAFLQRWTVDCGRRGLVGSRIRVDGLAESRTDVLLRLVLLDGRSFRSVLSADGPSFLVPERERRLDVVRGYLGLGLGHILTGFDHLAFVLGLVLLVVRQTAGAAAERRRLLWTITAFTLGHSVTLSLAVLGFVAVPPRPVEALIAFSIFLLAVELARGADEPPTSIRRFPWLMAFSFGLLHGLGFAGALVEVGLPAGEIPLALLSFNLGIEIGQIAFVLVVLTARVAVVPLAARLRFRTAWLPPYAIGGLAAFWCFERIRATFG